MDGRERWLGVPPFARSERAVMSETQGPENDTRPDEHEMTPRGWRARAAAPWLAPQMTRCGPTNSESHVGPQMYVVELLAGMNEPELKVHCGLLQQRTGLLIINMGQHVTENRCVIPTDPLTLLDDSIPCSEGTETAKVVSHV